MWQLFFLRYCGAGSNIALWKTKIKLPIELAVDNEWKKDYNKCCHIVSGFRGYSMIKGESGNAGKQIIQNCVSFTG